MFTLSALASIVISFFILRNRGGLAQHLAAVIVTLVAQGLFVGILIFALWSPDGWTIKQAAPYLLAGSLLVVAGCIFGMMIAAAWRRRQRG